MTARSRCSKCGAFGAHDDGRRCPFDRLVEALGDVELSPEEVHSLRWLAGVDWSTVDALVSIFRKLRAAC